MNRICKCGKSATHVVLFYSFDGNKLANCCDDCVRDYYQIAKQITSHIEAINGLIEPIRAALLPAKNEIDL